MDEDDKVRRNLVVASAAVVVVWFLEVPVASYLAEAVKDSSWAPPAWRIWLTVNLVMLYLALRYRFSKSYQAILVLMTGTFRGTVPEVAAAIVQRRLLANRRDARLGVNFEEIARRFHEQTERRGHGSPGWTIKLATANSREQYSGDMDLTVASEDGLFMSTQRTSYGLQGTLRFRCRVVAVWRSWLYSEAAVVSLFPWLLAAAAFAISLGKIGAALHSM